MSYIRVTQPTISLTIREADWDDVFSDIARVHLSHRPCIPAGRILTLEHKGKCVPLVARGAPNNTKDEIWLDLETRKKLGGLKPNRAYDFKIHRANWGECFLWAWSATDPAYRIPTKISTILGGIGIVLGVISLFT